MYIRDRSLSNTLRSIFVPTPAMGIFLLGSRVIGRALNPHEWELPELKATLVSRQHSSSHVISTTSPLSQRASPLHRWLEALQAFGSNEGCSGILSSTYSPGNLVGTRDKTLSFAIWRPSVKAEHCCWTHLFKG